MSSYTGTSISAGPVKAPSQPSVQEFSIRVPKNTKKRYHVMRFNSNLGVDFGEWKSHGTQVKMERENNFKEFRGGAEEENPKFGAGSEFGKEAKEEARKRKFGIVARKYKPDDQPWIMKIGGKNGKKFKGIREGGVSENTAYYVFTQAGKGIIDAYPLQEWYKFQPIQRYKALSAEEAEEEFGRRNKIINYFSVMVKKRLRNDEDGELDGDDSMKEKKPTGGNKRKKKDHDELKISEMDDWVDSDDESSSESDEDGEGKKKKEDGDEGGKKGKGGKGKAPARNKRKKKKRDSDDEAFEESDDGDEEGRELDYISESSESASDTEEMKANKELKGVAEEDALRKLLNSESEDEEEEEEKNKEENFSHSDDESNNKQDVDEENGNKRSKKKKNKGKLNKKDSGKKGLKKDDEGGSSSELSPNSSASDSDDAGAASPKKSGNGKSSSSRSSTPVPSAEKRKLTNAESAIAAAKKIKMDSPVTSSSSFLPIAGDNGVTEDAVRRYLMRKPMTTTELLQKFKSKKTGLSSEQLVNVMTQILKNINPVKQMIKNKMYLSIKPTPT